MILLFSQNIGYILFYLMSPPRQPLSRARRWDGHVVGLGGKARDRANVGLTWGWKTRHPIKAPHGAED